MKLCTLALAVSSLGAPLFAATADVEQPPIIVDEIIAKVNGEIITKSDVTKAQAEAAASAKKQNLSGEQLQAAVTEYDKNILRNKIDQALLVQKAKDSTINVDSELSKYMAELQKTAKIADPDKFHDFVRQETGMSYEDFKNQAKEGMLTRRIIQQEVGSKISVPHKDIEDYYNAHKTDFVRKEQIFVREILVSTEGKDAAGIAIAEKKAKDLSARGKKGEKFAELARDNSDAMTAQVGGDLGTGYEKGQLAPDLEAAVWSQPKGFVTDPIKVSSGFLILKVEDHQKEGQATLDEVSNEIMEKLYSPKMEPAVRTYLTKLRTEAFLQIKNGYVDSGAAPGQNTAWMSTAELKPETISKSDVNQKRHKKLFGAVPIPGTSAATSSSSK